MIRKIAALICAIVLLTSVFGSAFAETQTQKRFDEALDLLAKGDYAGAESAFSELGAYPNAVRYAMYAGALKNAEAGLFPLAVQDFMALGDFEDSELRVKYYKARQWEEDEEYEIAENYYMSIPGYLDSTARIIALPEKINVRDYAKADALERKNKLEEALEAFKKLDTYSDSKARVMGVQEKINARDYAAAAKLEEEEKLEEAIEAFRKLKGYSDSAARVTAIIEKINAGKYTAAAKLEEEGKLEDALIAFDKLGDYSDSANRVIEISEKIKARDYAAADLLEKEEHFVKAYQAFLDLGDYQDSVDRAAAIHDPAVYEEAMVSADVGQYKTAAELFTSLGDYRDSKDKAYVLGVSEYVDQLFRPTNGVFIFSHHDLYGMANYHDNILRPAYFDEIRAFENNHAAYRLGRKWGLLYTDGKALNPQWDDIGAFRNEIAVYTNSGKQGLLYEDGSTTPAEWSEIKPFVNIGNDRIAEVVLNGLIGYIDTKGNTVIEPKWNRIGSFSSVGGKYLAEAVLNGKHGFIDSTGNEVLAAEWDAVSGFNSDGVCIIANKNDSSYYCFGLADAEGNILSEPVYARLGRVASGSYDEDDVLLPPAAGDTLMMVVTQQEKYGFINDRGELMVDTVYDNAKEFSEGLSAVKKDGLWGYIDKTGAVVIQPEYQEVTSFNNNKADVLVKDSGWHIIDQSNKRIYYTSDAIAEAEKLLQDGKYAEAADAFEKLLGLDPSLKIKMQTALYSAAEKALASDDYDSAIAFFSKAGDYSDSGERMLKIYYDLAEKALASEDYNSAINYFAKAANYNNSIEKILKIHYDLAEKALASEDWDTASSEFKGAAGYKDATDRVKEPYYKKADKLLASEDYAGAIELFTELGEYMDSAERILKIHYDLAEKALASEDWDTASSEFEAAVGYQDAIDRVKESYYKKAESLFAQGEYTDAMFIFSELGEYSDSKAQVQNIKNALLHKAINEEKFEETLGTHIYFGRYEQDGNTANGMESIEWVILDYADHKFLLLSNYALDAMPFNNKKATITWEKCSLRKWLNKEFLNLAFDDSELKSIIPAEVKNNETHSLGEKNQGKDTVDSVFLLSVLEATDYHKYYDSQCSGTKYVLTKLAYYRNSVPWFLRSVKKIKGKQFAFEVSAVFSTTNPVNTLVNDVTDIIGIRPAIWIDVSAIN